jgi:thioredoxin reductase (NADPH)
MPLSHPELGRGQKAQLAEAGVVVTQGALLSLSPRRNHMDVFLEGRTKALAFDVLYPALGTRPRSELAKRLGLRLDRKGCIPRSAVKKTAVPGLCAAGDVVEGLDQISVAMGHGAVSATSAHNWLRDLDRHSLQTLK